MQSYEAIVRCAAAACGTPMATLGIVEQDRAHFKASVGAHCAETLPLTFSLLAETLAHDDVFVVSDTHADARFASSPIVTAGPRVRFYAGAALRDESGAPLGIIAVADKNARSATPEQIASLRDFAKIASDMLRIARRLCVLDRALDDATDCVTINEFVGDAGSVTRRTYVNASALERTGFTREEFLAPSSDLLAGPLTDFSLIEQVHADIRRGITRQFELPIYCKDGSHFWTEVRWQPLADEDGIVRRYLSICRDLTERYRSEERVRLLTRAVDEALDLVLVTDSTPPSKGGPFMHYANRQLLAALGYEPCELKGIPYGLIIAEENDPAAVQSIVEHLEQMRDCEKEILLRRKDGSTFWVEFASRPLTAPDGTPTHWVAVGRDITARRRTHEQMAVLVNAIDSVSDHIEIYALEDGAYVAAFQNAASDPDASLFVETVLNQQPLKDRLQRGENVTLPNDGLLFRPLGQDAKTVICVRRQPWLAAAS